MCVILMRKKRDFSRMVKHRRKTPLIWSQRFNRYAAIPSSAAPARRAVLAAQTRGWRIRTTAKPVKAKLSSKSFKKSKGVAKPAPSTTFSSSSFRRRRWVPDPSGTGGHWSDGTRPVKSTPPSLSVRDERLKGWASKHGAPSIKYDRPFPSGGILVKVWMSGQWRTARLSGPYDGDYILRVAGFPRPGEYKTLKYKWLGGHRPY